MAKYMRHLFANPKKPHMCIILSLAIYLACVPPTPNAVKLFGGSKQDNRYLKVMYWSKLVNSNLLIPLLKSLHTFVKMIEHELNARGITISQIGSHTSRKTGASYVSSISAIHSYTAFCLRFGWALLGSQARYVQNAPHNTIPVFVSLILNIARL